MELKRILILGAHIHYAIPHEWTVDLLDKRKFEIHFMLMNDQDSDLETFLSKHPEVSYTRIQYQGKKDLLKATWLIFRYLLNNKIQVIHTHLFDANIAGLVAAKLAGVKKRIYTRHHSSYHHQYYPKIVKYDKLVTNLATDVIAISKNVKSILINQEGCKPKKITTIHHGLDINAFTKVDAKRVDALRSKYNLEQHHRVIGVISRYIHWKGIQFIIPAFRKILEQFPNAVLVLANARGEYADEVQKLLNEQLAVENYREITFEPDFIALYQLFEVFVHTPIDTHSEAFGQIYVEALASKIPSVFSMSGIAHDFIVNQHNALVVAHQNIEEIYEAILTLLNNDELKKTLIKNGFNDVVRLFQVQSMIDAFESLYLQP